MRILHFSDFHLEKEGINQSKLLMDRMMEVVCHLNSERNFDLIIFSGDMIDKGAKSFNSSQEAYESFYEVVISRICHDLNIDETKFIAVPGNHEVSRKLIDRKSDIILEKKLLSHEAIENHLIDTGTNQGFNERLRDYDTYYRGPWLSKISGRFPHHTTVKLADHLIVEADGRRIGISLLNTAWRCGEKIIYKNPTIESLAKAIKRFTGKLLSNKNERVPENRVILGSAQINHAKTFFRENHADYKFAVAHHHYTLLGEPDNHVSDTCIRSSYNFCFFGHTHSHDAEQSKKHSGTIIATTAPGIIRWNAASSNYKNGFSVWDIDFSRGIAYEQQWIQDIDHDFKNDYGKYEWHFGERELIVDFQEFRNDSAAHHTKEIPISIDGIVNELVSTHHDSIILYGLSGIGKTHLLRNVLDIKKENISNIYKKIFYCERGENLFDQLRDNLDSFFRRYRDQDICLICDNTNHQTFNDIKRLRDSLKSNIRLIGVINNISPHNKSLSGIPIIELSLDDIAKEVNSYIDSNISDLKKRDIIKRFSDGFPNVAIKLVEATLKDENFDLSTVHNILSGLYGQLAKEVDGNDDLYELLQAMALFQPFPKLDNDSMDLWNCTHLSCLHDKSRSDILQLIRKAKTIWNGELIEDSPSGYSIRPFSLAIRLADQWLKNHGPGGFADFLEDISHLTPNQQKTVITCIQQRISGMHLSQGAREAFERLADENGVFRSENVVLSDLGSQLILAASNVNPAAIANSLKMILSSKSSDEIVQINYFARRNMVFALTKLIYYPESFKDAMTSLALLATNETEGTISNNSQGVFEQVFHVFLSGTSVNLQDRIEWLTETIRDQRTTTLLPKAIKGAMAWGRFFRTGNIGADCDDCKDFQPSYDDIKEYWAKCTNLALKDIETNGNVEFYSDIISNNIHLWVDSNVTDWIFPFIEAIVTNEKSTFHLLEYDFNDIIIRIGHMNPSLASAFGNLKRYIVSDDFLSKLLSFQQEYYMNSISNEPDQEIKFFKPLAEEFIGNDIYMNIDEIDRIVLSTEFYSWAFCAAISNYISDTDLSTLYAQILKSPSLKDNLISPFLMTLCSMTRNRECTKKFISNIHERRTYGLYTRLMARTEDEALSNLNVLKSEFKDNDNSFDFLPLYLHHVSLTISSQDLLLHYLNQNFDTNQDEIMQYLITHYCFTPLSDERVCLLKKIIYRYSLRENSGIRIDDLIRFELTILKYERDEKFASYLSDFFLKTPDIHYTEHAFAELYGFLINDYQDLLLDTLVEEMSDETNFTASFRLSQALGSGYGFGTGPLFAIDDNILKRTLNKHGIKAARLFAKICPVFDQTIQFSKWIIYLLDNYGEDKGVTDNISYNMGCFSWTGSLIPLLDKKIKCFEKLSGHPISAVKQWAEKNIKELRIEKLNEETKEDFLNQLYR